MEQSMNQAMDFVISLKNDDEEEGRRNRHSSLGMASAAALLDEREVASVQSGQTGEPRLTKKKSIQLPQEELPPLNHRDILRSILLKAAMEEAKERTDSEDDKDDDKDSSTLEEPRIYSFDTRPGRTWYYHVDSPPGHHVPDAPLVIVKAQGIMPDKRGLLSQLRAIRHKKKKKLRGAVLRSLLKGKPVRSVVSAATASYDGGSKESTAIQVDMEMVSISSDESSDDDFDRINIPMFAPILGDDPPSAIVELDGEAARLNLQRRRERRRSSFAHQVKQHHMHQFAQGDLVSPVTDVAQQTLEQGMYVAQQTLGATGQVVSNVATTATMSMGLIQPLRRSRRRLGLGRLKTIWSSEHIIAGSNSNVTEEE